MEYRKLPRGEEKLSVIGLGSGSLGLASEEEIEAIIKEAIKRGINFFDLCAGNYKVYQPFGKAIKGIREKVHFQLHFGAVYKADGEYSWSRDLNKIKSTIKEELKLLNTDYIDYGFLHCIDDFNDLEDVKKNGIIDYLIELKAKGVVKHLGFSSHTPSVTNKLLDLGIFDIIMFSINPAYDFEMGDEYGIGSLKERSELFSRCEKEGIAISVMKPFNGGQLLNDSTSPFKHKLTKEQCIKYCLDRPGVTAVVPGVRSLNDLHELLHYENATKEELDYSLISGFTSISLLGKCVYCNHCEPCPKGIDIGLVNKYYDLALVGDEIAYNHYLKLKVNASACIKCGHCNKRCPFKVDQVSRMIEIDKYFKNNQS